MGDQAIDDVRRDRKRHRQPTSPEQGQLDRMVKETRIGGGLKKQAAYAA